MIFRIDDISNNTDLDGLYDVIEELHNLPVPTEFLLCVNMISKKTDQGSVYPGVPFKDHPKPFFYDVDEIMSIKNIAMGDHSFSVASHGLIHADHSRLDADAQAMSIVTSCNLLKTNNFVPPFNRYNKVTEEICRIHGINLIKPDGWKSLDYTEFDINHDKWYLHPWRWNVDSIKEKVVRSVDGFVPRVDEAIAR